MEIRIVTMSEFHKNGENAVFMELHGIRRVNKPQSSLFNKHYYNTAGRKMLWGRDTFMQWPDKESTAAGWLEGRCRHTADNKARKIQKILEIIKTGN